MILDHHIAVVFKSTAKGRPEHERKILNSEQWVQLQIRVKQGHFIILEAWDITTGKCLSN